MSGDLIEPYEDEVPWNETPQNLRDEEAAKLVIERAFKCKIQKLYPQLYKIDWSIHFLDGRLRAFGEYKHRAVDYAEFLLGAKKYEAGMTLATTYEVDFVFFVETPALGIRYAHLSASPLPKMRLAGSNRGQRGDIEPCAHIPADWFKPLPVVPEVTDSAECAIEAHP